MLRKQGAFKNVEEHANYVKSKQKLYLQSGLQAENDVCSKQSNK